MTNEYTSRKIEGCGTVVFNKVDTSMDHYDIADRFIKALFTSFIEKCLPGYNNKHGYIQMPYLFSERQLDSALLPALYDLCNGEVLAEMPITRTTDDGTESSGRVDYYCMYKDYSIVIEVKHVYQSIKNVKTKEANKDLKDCWDTMTKYLLKSISNGLKSSYEERKGIIRLALEFVALKDGSKFKESECGKKGFLMTNLDILASKVSPSPTHIAAWYINEEIVEGAAEHQGVFCPVLALLAKAYPRLR